EAERKAIAGFGDPKAIAAQFVGLSLVRQVRGISEQSEGIGRLSTKRAPRLHLVWYDHRNLGGFGRRRRTAYCTAAARGAAMLGFHSSCAFMAFRNQRRFYSWSARSHPYETSAIDHTSVYSLNQSAVRGESAGISHERLHGNHDCDLINAAASVYLNSRRRPPAAARSHCSCRAASTVRRRL